MAGGFGKSYSRVQRGMVFWFDPAKYGETGEYKNSAGRVFKSHVQMNNRPWLVVSTDEGNATSCTCNIVPITSEDKTPLPCHVNFMYLNKKQTILVEQIRTADINALGAYMYVLNDSVMKEVEKAVAGQFGVRPSVTYIDLKLDNIVKHLEATIDNIIKEKAELLLSEKHDVIPQEQIEDAAVRLGATLDKLLKAPEKPQEEDSSQFQGEVSAPIKGRAASDKYSGMSQVEKFNAKYGLNDKKPNKRNTWTVENRQQFLQDCDTLTPQAVMKKWGLKTVNSVFSTKYAHRVALEKLKEGNEVCGKTNKG